MGERSLDATAGNPQSAGGKAWRKRCAARSIDVHDRPWDINVPKSHFYELILQDRHPNTISKLSAKYQFCAISTADTRDGKLTTRGVYPWVVHRLSIVCPPFVHRLYPPPNVPPLMTRIWHYRSHFMWSKVTSDANNVERNFHFWFTNTDLCRRRIYVLKAVVCVLKVDRLWGWSHTIYVMEWQQN